MAKGSGGEDLMADIVELLTERRKIRYAGNCKCGKCCLVPHEMLCSAIDEIKRGKDAVAELVETLELARGHLNEMLHDTKWHPIGHCPVLDRVDAVVARAKQTAREKSP